MTAADPRGRTQPVQSTTDRPDVPEAAPRLPHEHDESSDSQQSAPRPVIRQAHEDVKRGLVDTDRGTPADESYQQQKSPAQRPAVDPSRNPGPDAATGPRER